MPSPYFHDQQDAFPYEELHVIGTPGTRGMCCSAPRGLGPLGLLSAHYVGPVAHSALVITRSGVVPEGLTWAGSVLEGRRLGGRCMFCSAQEAP